MKKFWLALTAMLFCLDAHAAGNNGLSMVEFRILCTDATANCTTVSTRTQDKLQVQTESALTLADIEEASVQGDDLMLRFKDPQTFMAFTTSNLRKRAVVLVNGWVLSTAVIATPIPGGTMKFPVSIPGQTAQTLAADINEAIASKTKR